MNQTKALLLLYRHYLSHLKRQTHQVCLIYLIATRSGTSTEQMPTRFLIITEATSVLTSTLNELISVLSYWTFAWCQNQTKEFSSSNYRQAVSAAFALAQFVSGGDR
jgi:hypothetical protein